MCLSVVVLFYSRLCFHCSFTSLWRSMIYSEGNSYYNGRTLGLFLIVMFYHLIIFLNKTPLNLSWTRFSDIIQTLYWTCFLEQTPEQLSSTALIKDKWNQLAECLVKMETCRLTALHQSSTKLVFAHGIQHR